MDTQPPKNQNGEHLIDRESVKMLAIAVGVREAARQVGIPESTVQAWSARHHWFKKQPLPKSVQQKNGTTSATIDPSTALQSVLSTRKDKSRLNFSKYVLNASKVAARSRSPLQDAPRVRDAASVMEKVWPQEQVKAEGSLNLSILAQAAQVNVVSNRSPEATGV